MKSKSQSGVALVITLLMLSVITFLTVAFLAVSRRDRASVTVMLYQRDARTMADIGMARAQSEIISRMMVTNLEGAHELLNFDYMVSKNYIRKAGFQQKLVVDYENVNYDHYNNTTIPLSETFRIQNIANLRYDPRAPVFVQTNITMPEKRDFRFWLDINRNGLFEDSGYLRVTNNVNGRAVVTTSNSWLEGDPQWVGVLAHPDAGHSKTNQFIGRYAFIVQPVGKELDLNYVHNHLKNTNIIGTVNRDYYLRGSGNASWDLNLAATLTTLNTNIYRSDLAGYDYTHNSNNIGFGPNSGFAFDDANILLSNRFSGKMPYLTTNHDRTYYNLLDLQDSTNEPYLWRLMTNNADNTYDRTISTYDRYTISRLLSTMGTDSTQDQLVDLSQGKNWTGNQKVSAVRAKVNLNIDNVYQITNVLNRASMNEYSWQYPYLDNRWPETNNALRFFTNAADILLRSEFDNVICITNIPIYCSTNVFVRYNGRIHRCLQLAANLYDASHSNIFPSVFRPLCKSEAKNNVTNTWIVGFVQVTNNFQSQILPRGFFNMTKPNLTTNDNVLGLPYVVGVKKGFPSLYKLAVTNSVTMVRKLRVYKASPTAPVSRTNQMYLFNVENAFAFTVWNSYTNNYIRPTFLFATNWISGYMANEIKSPNENFYGLNRFPRYFAGGTGDYIPGSSVNLNQINTVTNCFISRSTNLPVFIPENKRSNNVWLQYSNHILTPTSTNEAKYENISGLPVYDWRLGFTNQILFALIDYNTKYLIDFVNIQINTNFSQYELTMNPPETTAPESVKLLWNTNGATSSDSSYASVGVSNQIAMSLKLIDSHGALPTDSDTEKQVDGFQKWWNGTVDSKDWSLWHDVPLQASNTIQLKIHLQANDPLVHYTMDDLVSPDPKDVKEFSMTSTGTRYKPWNKSLTGETTVTDATTSENNPFLKDTWITRSDDWSFPSNSFQNVGEIGRVHRGTPWQTVYLKSDLAPVKNMASWQKWMGSVYDTNGNQVKFASYPTNDWKMLDLFTVAPNNNAAYGTLSVNQTNEAAWAAVFSGAVLPVPGGTVVFHPTNAIKVLNGYSADTYARSINYIRKLKSGQVYHKTGEILEAATLTYKSPLLSDTNYISNTNLTDRVLEAIPQSSMSLLSVGKPRFIIWGYGQSLMPAPNGYNQGSIYFGLCTNYQITGESLVRMLCHVVETNGSPKIVVDNYNVVP